MLDTTYENCWIGRRRPVKNLFFFYGLCKNFAYTECITTDQKEPQRIIDAFATITPAMLVDIERTLQARIDRCLEWRTR